MSIILLIIGLGLFYIGRIELGTVQAEGRRVKAAGGLLAIPGILDLTLNLLFIPLAFGRNIDARAGFQGVVEVLVLLLIFGAVGLAYLLIFNPPNAPRLPGILGDIQAEAPPPSDQAPVEDKAAEAPNKTIAFPTPSTPPKPQINREKFPSVMSLREAARYLQKSEDEVLELIETGKLVAARDNYRYRIAKSQLDELL